MRLVSWFLIQLLRLYRLFISPALVACFGSVTGCRFHPTCSAFAMEAIQKHGAVRGLWLTVCRLGRCHPWGGSGPDPVPEPRSISSTQPVFSRPKREF